LFNNNHNNNTNNNNNNNIIIVFPLMVIIGVAAAREAVEDYGRYRSDVAANSDPFEVIVAGGGSVVVPSRALRVGDLIKVEKGRGIPADCLLLRSGGKDPSICFVETSNLDGETNLKPREAIQETSQCSPTSLQKAGFEVECEPPNEHLYQFLGRCSLGAADASPAGEAAAAAASASKAAAVVSSISLAPKQLLLRGSQVRNVPYVLAMVLYTGVDTKLFLNLRPAPSKLSSLERRLNWYVAVMFSLLAALCILFAIVCRCIDERTISKLIYLAYGPGHDHNVHGLLNLLTYLVLFNTFIPQSLFVTIEIVKFAQAVAMNLDPAMRKAGTKDGMKAKTSNLNEELGEISFLFSDKTGTLTENEMLFRSYCLGDKTCTPHEMDSLIALQDKAEEAVELLTAMALCHTVVTEVDSGGYITYQAQSPDEAALVSAATANGVAFLSRDGNRLVLSLSEEVRALPTDLDLELFEREARAASSVSFTEPAAFCGVNGALLRSSGSEGAAADSRTPAMQTVPGSNVSSSSKVDVDEVGAGSGCSSASLGVDSSPPAGPRMLAAAFPPHLVYELLATLEFNATRRRMSVVVRAPDGRILVITKGADVVMLGLLARPGSAAAAQRASGLEQALTLYARQGLRTLVVGQREVPKAEYASWRARYDQALSSLTERDERLMAVAAELEVNLELLGATAVEDRLQEDVPETISFLHDCGIKVWVLTGDKEETAVSIGYSTQLLVPERGLCTLTRADTATAARALVETAVTRHGSALVSDVSASDSHRLMHSSKHVVLQHAVPSRGPFSVVVDGGTLRWILDDPILTLRFLGVAQLAESVVCCRVTPLQKAAVVALVRRRLGAVTLAIGDGANDVSMIQEAHVGVGIFGKEGTQAARASDYALREFRHLRRLLAVHGRFSLLRISGVVGFSFYKNLVFTLCQVIFSGFTGFSGQTVYDSWLITSFNVIATSLVPLAYGLFETDVRSEVALTYPELYLEQREAGLYSPRRYLSFLLNALAHALIIFFTCFVDFVLPDGRSVDLWSMGLIVATAVVVVVNLKSLILARSINLAIVPAALLGITGYFSFAAIYCNVQSMSPNMYRVLETVSRTPLYFFRVFFAIFTCLSLDFGVRAWGDIFHSSLWQEATAFWKQARREDRIKSNRGPSKPSTQVSSIPPLVRKF
jgi:phospholipid-translocating ATPase